MFQDFIINFQDFQGHLKKLPSSIFAEEDRKLLQNEPFRIVIVGGVGVGKSSVIERIICNNSYPLKLKLIKGKDGCCTRRPIIIRYPITASLEINEEDAKIVTEEPLILNSEGSIEFCDLPGLTGMSRPDQPSKYPEMTQRIFDNYVQSADIILLCLPADVDFVNSDALRRLKQLDIEEDRIIGVVSKVDLLEEPEKIDLDICNTFGSVVLIRNAPNLEINESIQVINHREDDFFKSFNFQQQQQPFLTGIEGLKSEITRILTKMYEKKKNFTISRLKVYEKQLQEKLRYLKDPNLPMSIILDYINRTTLELQENKRLNFLFWNSLPEAFEGIDPLEGINRSELKFLLKNSQGLNASLTEIEPALKVLLKRQLGISEKIINKCLFSVVKELKEILHVEGEEAKDETFEEEVEVEVDEFFDVNSDIEEDGILKDIQDSRTIFEKDSIKLVSGLSKLINETISNLIRSCHDKTKSFLEDYCAIQREIIFCRDSKYLETFKQYDRRVLKRSGSLGNNFSRNRSISSVNMNPSAVPMTRIDSESLDSIDYKPNYSSLNNNNKQQQQQQQQQPGFIKELLELLFPSSGGNKMKRVEYRPRAYKPIFNMVNQNDKIEIEEDKITTPLVIEDSDSLNEEFILKLLEIYLNSYHRQLSDFIPKCINFHLIQRIIKHLPTVLLLILESRGTKSSNDGKRELVKMVEMVEMILKIIKEIKEIG